MEGFIQEEETALPHNSDFVPSKVFSVSRREGEDAWVSVLYIREHLVHFEKKIMKELWNNPKKSKLYVKGSPGCGKTCFFYLWARLRSFRENKRVLVVQFRENSNFIWIREGGGALWRMDKAISPYDLLETVREVLKANEEAKKSFDLCIHDGVLDRKDICSNMLGMLNTAVVNGIIKKVVHVTSLAFSLSTGGQRLDSSGSILRLSVDSWRLQDYHEAVKCQEFADRMMNSQGSILSNDKKALENSSDDDDASDKDEKPKNEAAGVEKMMGAGDEMVDDGVSGDGDKVDSVSWHDVIETKYYYAGGSARFMFDFKLSELKGELDERCKNVYDDQWKFFAHGAVAPGIPNAVSTLMQQFQDRASPVSKYILFQAYEKCKTELVKAVKAAADCSDNPALKGWAFELEQIDLIRLSLASCQENPEYVTNNNGLSFRPHSEIDFDEKMLKSGTIREEGTIIWCLKWNQGCFDVAFYKKPTLVTLQFTVSEEHTLKPKFTRRLRDELLKEGFAVDKFVHVGVKEAKPLQFKLDTSGTGRQGNAKEAQFTINAYYSPPLEKKTATPTVVFQTELSPILKKVEMWELATAKKRRTNEDVLA